MMTMATRASRPIPIIRVCATGRVPFGFRPVTAAKAATTTARPSHTSQFMVERWYSRREPYLSAFDTRRRQGRCVRGAAAEERRRREGRGGTVLHATRVT